MQLPDKIRRLGKWDVDEQVKEVTQYELNSLANEVDRELRRLKALITRLENKLNAR